MNQNPTNQLLEEFKNGSEDTFQTLCHQYAPLIHTTYQTYQRIKKIIKTTIMP